ncbi:hypothetical protein Tco_0044570 [Tanacetum coccineum]
MESLKTIKYAPQVKNMILEAVEFPNNNYVELAKPPKDSVIKFTMKNGKKLLSFKFKTFVETTGLDYNKVNQPHTNVVKTELLKLGLDNDKNEAKEASVLFNKTPLLKTWVPAGWRLLVTFVIQHESSMSPSPFPEKKRKNKGQTVTKPKPNSQDPDYGALLEETKDEEFPNFSNEDILVAGDDMETNKSEHTANFSTRSSSPSDLGFKDVDNIKHVTERILSRNLRFGFEVLFAQMEIENEDKHVEVATSYVDLRESVEGFCNEYLTTRAHTAITIHREVLRAEFKLKEKVKSLIDTKLNNSKNLSEVTKLLRRGNIPNDITSFEAIQGAVNQQHAHHTTFDRPIRSLTWNLGPRLTKIEETQTNIQTDLAIIKTSTSEIESVVSEIYQVFKSPTSFTPLGSSPYQAVTPTEVNAPVDGGESCPSLCRKPIL